jgi:hypothetical protein
LRLIKIVLTVTLMLFAATGFAAKKEKTLICHVGNEEGPGGETYLDDPGCMPIEDNGYFCPDAGKIDLIEVSKTAKHLGNLSHEYDGISDYLPEDVYASGEGQEDSNEDGIDDGCEPLPGDTPIGTITEDINRGGSPPGSDRGVESAAVNLVADAQWWATSSIGSEIAFVNPGSVRSDLLYLESALEGDGVVTLGELFILQPFGNDLVTFPMTGAQIVAVLEEQCQPPGSSRSILHLGVSDGFTYDLATTIVAGDCTSITLSNVQLNGVNLNPVATYLVTVNSFISDGGDRFSTFATIDPATKIYGVTDLQAMTSYLAAFSPVAPPATDRVNEL